MEYVLSMVFLTEKGLKSTISINGVKSNLTKEQANSLMELIIARNIFLPNAGALSKKDSAQLTERKITKFEVA
jgi:hypothetical protein